MSSHLINHQCCIQNHPDHTALLRVFRWRPLRYLNLSFLQRESGLSAEKVVQGISELQEQGLRIGARPPEDFFYEPNEQILHPDLISAQLQTRWWGRAILVGEELSSTIDIAKASRESHPESHGLVVLANCQTRGRGRQGNAWTSPRGKDILISFFIRQEEWFSAPSLLSLYAVTAAARVLHTAYQIPISIKWPNDLMANGKKLGGVLVERIPDTSLILVSMGINVHSQPSEWPEALRAQTISLALLNSCEWKRDTLIAQLGTTWEALWESMRNDRGETVRGYWKQYSSTLGKRVRLYYRMKPLTGLALDIDEVGRLLFRSDDGSLLSLLPEEVQHLRLEE